MLKTANRKSEKQKTSTDSSSVSSLEPNAPNKHQTAAILLFSTQLEMKPQ